MLVINRFEFTVFNSFYLSVVDLDKTVDFAESRECADSEKKSLIIEYSIRIPNHDR